MGGDLLGVLGLQRGELAGELAEGCFGGFDAEIAGLVESREGFIYAGDGEFVGRDVEVLNGVVDELGAQRDVLVKRSFTLLVEGRGKGA